MCELCKLNDRSAESRNFRPNFDEDNSEQLDQPPVFVHKPRSLNNLIEGQNAHFEAKVTPITDPSLRIEWYKDGRPITVGHRFRPIHDFGYVALDIVGLISEDSGEYTCRAINRLGYAEVVVSLKCFCEYPNYRPIEP